MKTRNEKRLAIARQVVEVTEACYGGLLPAGDLAILQAYIRAWDHGDFARWRNVELWLDKCGIPKDTDE